VAELQRQVGEATQVRVETLQALHGLVVSLESGGNAAAAGQVAYAMLLLQRHWLERGWR
jgi:hypothetical protein